MSRRAWVIVAVAVVVLVALVPIGRWEERRAAREQVAGMQSVLDAVGGNIVSRSLSGYRYGPPDCLAYFDQKVLFALQLCFDSEGRLVEAVDRRPAQPHYYGVEYKPTLSTLRFSRTKIDKLLQVAVSGS